MPKFSGNDTVLRAAYPHRTRIAARWNDLDVFGHVNNAIYYEYFDSVINGYLIEAGGNNPSTDGTMQFCVENRCQYYRELGFPQTIEAGLRVAKLGTSSVCYDLALFAENTPEPVALGYFVHVFVARTDRQPVPIPTPLRDALRHLLVEPTTANRLD